MTFLARTKINRSGRAHRRRGHHLPGAFWFRAIERRHAADPAPRLFADADRPVAALKARR